jgi:hypothetical protein
MKLVRLLTALVVSVGLSVVVVAPASAHTPSLSADCSGVHLSGTNYDPEMTNRWSVTINGVTHDGTFGSSFQQTFPVPQDGTTTTWSGYVEAEDGSYHGEDAGSVGPCGTPTDACTDLDGTQPPGTPCSPPADVVRSDHKSLEGCDVKLLGVTYGAGELSYDEEFTDTYVFDAESNTWKLVPDTSPTITHLDFTPWSAAQKADKGCTHVPVQPPATHSSDSSTALDCDAGAVVTTTETTTTPFVLDEETNSWVPGQPQTHTTTSQSPAPAGDCDDDAEVSPTVARTPHSSAPTASTPALVPTAVDAGLAGPVPAAVTPVAASRTNATGPTGHGRAAAVLLLVAGVAMIAIGGRPRRSS